MPEPTDNNPKDAPPKSTAGETTVRLSDEERAPATRRLEQPAGEELSRNGELAAPTRREGRRAAPREGKKSKIPRIVLALLVLLGVALIVFASRGGENKTTDRQKAQEAASKAAESKEKERKAAAIGEPAELAKLQGTVIQVNRNAQPADPAHAPPPGQRYFAVEFRLTNRDDRAVTIVAANQFKLKDSADQKYGVSNSGVPDPRFPDGAVAPGQTVQGWIAFQIPQDAKNLKLQFNARVPRT